MFEVVNPNTGKISINDTYRNFHLRRSGKLNASDFIYGPTGSNFTQRCWAEISTVGCKSPMLVLRGPLDTIVTPHHSLYQNKFYLHTWWNYTKAGGVEWYLFDDWTPPNRADFGLELRDAANNVTYNSGWHRLKVLQMLNAPNFGPGISAYRDIPATDYGRRMGVCMLNPRVSSVQTSGEIMSVIQEAICFLNDSVLRVGQTVAIDGDGWWNLATGFWNTTPLFLLTVDIENLPLGINYG